MLVADTLIEPANSTAPTIDSLPSGPKASALNGRTPPRYVPERGLVRRIRSAQANDGLGQLAARHELDPETQAQLSSELIKAGAPPITPAAAEKALSRLVSFEPLNVDALHPFILLAMDRWRWIEICAPKHWPRSVWLFTPLAAAFGSCPMLPILEQTRRWF